MGQTSAATLPIPGLSLEQAIRVDSLPQDEAIRERTRRFIGSVATGSSVRLESIEKTEANRYASLLEAGRQAFMGDMEARRNVATNGRIAAAEAILKVGNVTEVEGWLQADGSISQYGQGLTDIHRNSLAVGPIAGAYRRRLEAEAYNFQRIEAYVKQGILDTHYLFIPSLYADDMSDEEAEAMGMFADTKTGVLQAVTMEGGKYVVQSAFVAGAEAPGASRHDIKTMQAVYTVLNLEAPETVTDMLEHPILMPKSLMPGGVMDFARLYDDALGSEYFFGQRQPRQDYTAFAQFCRDREKRLEPRVQAITDEFVGQSLHARTPLEAIELLYEIVNKHVVMESVDDTSIDASVFGREAALHIEEARFFRAQGDAIRAELSLHAAQRTARVTMCGMGAKKKDGSGSLDDDPFREADTEEANEEDTEITDKLIRCINAKCRKLVLKSQVVRKDAWCCPKCKIRVDICTGEITYHGDSSSKPAEEQTVIWSLDDYKEIHQKALTKQFEARSPQQSEAELSKTYVLAA